MYRELATRLMDLLEKWMKENPERMGVLEAEQLLNTLPTAVQIWVRERKPKMVAEAGQFVL